MKRVTILILFLLVFVKSFAPPHEQLFILLADQIEPFEELLEATRIVESNNNDFALNEREGAYGALQIRQCRIEHFNRLSGKNYRVEEMYDYEKAKEVFLYFASMYSPYEIERISKRWNGSGPMTEIYWNKIKTLL